MIKNHDEDVLNTYRYLRLGMVSLTALLAAAVMWQIFVTGPKRCLQTSISAYYYTSARAVFVAALCALGASLIVYKGNNHIEDVLLNFTGTAAFVVAFVPTGVDKSCEASNVPTTSELTAAVRNNVWGLLVIAVITAIATRIVNPSQFKWGSWSGLEKFFLIITTLAQVAAAIWFIVDFFTDSDSFVRRGHAAAAFSLFAGIVLVALANAISYAQVDPPPGSPIRKYANRYAVVAVAMIVVIAAIVIARLFDSHWRHVVFWLEAAVITGFGAFWIVQTQELWNVVKRQEKEENAQAATQPVETS